MKRITLLLLLLIVGGSAMAQLNPMSPIPADKQVRVGKMENGLTYYIRHNEKPKNQADFYILHDVGAIQESDSQQGLAHFLEHMAFNGTKNLPGKMLIEYLETVGVKFGYNLNAGTGWDQTTYLVKDVPTTREGIIDSALLVLHDWSHFISLNEKEIDAERGVIKEELRTRDNAQWRSTIELIKSLGKGTRYEHRNLIGYLEGLESFKYEDLKAFYHQWYRPDYQAVIVVGDVDVDQVESKIKALMSDIPAPAADASQKESIVVPDNQEPIISIYTDPEMSGGSRVQLIVKRPALPKQYNNLIYGAMVDMIEAYAQTMENARLQEIAMKPGAPFLQANMGMGSVGVIPTLSSTIFMAATEDGKLNAGIEAIYAEMEKVRRFGFTQGEFERAQNDLMRSAERGYANRNDRTNAYYVQRYLNNFSENKAIPDAEMEWKLDSLLIKSLNVEAINAYMQQVLTPHNQIFAITAPEKEGIVNPTEAEVLAIREKVSKMELQPYEDNIVKEPLIPEGTVLKGSPVKKTLVDEQLGTTEWQLKNGIKVILKPTTFKADELMLRAQAWGGLSLLSDEEYHMGELMPAVNQLSGVGKFSASELKKQLSGKSASVHTSVAEYSSSLSGSCSPKDVETMLQLLWLNFNQPRFDKDDYTKLTTMVRAQLENLKSNPDYIMQEQATNTAYGNNPRREPLAIKHLDAMKFEALPAVYQKLYPSANSFTFVFTGNIAPEVLKPLVEKYIGSLPVAKKPTKAIDDNAHVVKGKVVNDFKTAMLQPKVSVYYLFSGDVKAYTMKERLTMNFLYQALNSRYLVSIREEKGGTYGVHVFGSVQSQPKTTYELTIAFDTNEQMADELCEIVLKEIEEIATNGPKSEDVEKNREYLAKMWKNNLEENSAWNQWLLDKYLCGSNAYAEYEATLQAITGADLQALAQRILADGNQVKVVMRPEAK